MDPIVLDSIPFELDIPPLLEALHVGGDDDDAARVRELADKAQAIARPKVLYREAYVNQRGDKHVVVDGIWLTSRVLTVNLEGVHRVFPHVATCGTEVEEWSNSLDDMLERYWVDRIKEMALGAATRAFTADLEKRCRPGKTAVMDPGSLDDWPLGQQGQLFSILGEVRELIGVELTESFLMLPIKSVSGLRFPTEGNFESCELCRREDCPSRRVPYDPELFDKKYRTES